jgi:hypothetical protein
MNNRTSPFLCLILLGIIFGSCKKTESVTPAMSITDTISIAEGTLQEYKVIIPVTLSAAADKQVSLFWSTSDNTAIAGEDYLAANGSYIVFNPGETTKNIEILIFADSTYEPDETFSVTISNVKNAVVKTYTTTVIITNDDVFDPNPAQSDISCWLTKPDKSVLLKKQNVGLNFTVSTNQYPTINVDTTTTYQVMDGFGYALTGGSAYLINNLTSVTRDALLKEMFLLDDNSIGVSYLRISIGASDLSLSVFSYDDMPSGQTDVNLTNFSLAPDRVDLIPVLKSVLQLNPKIKILGSPWSPPVWMKSNKSSVDGGGGRLMSTIPCVRVSCTARVCSFSMNCQRTRREFSVSLGSPYLALIESMVIIGLLLSNTLATSLVRIATSVSLSPMYCCHFSTRSLLPAALLSFASFSERMAVAMHSGNIVCSCLSKERM